MKVTLSESTTAPATNFIRHGAIILLSVEPIAMSDAADGELVPVPVTTRTGGPDASGSSPHAVAISPKAARRGRVMAGT